MHNVRYRFALDEPPFLIVFRQFKVRRHLINFPGASTQTPQGRLPSASQERGIRTNLASLGINLNAANSGECILS